VYAVECDPISCRYRQIIHRRTGRPSVSEPEVLTSGRFPGRLKSFAVELKERAKRVNLEIIEVNAHEGLYIFEVIAC